MIIKLYFTMSCIFCQYLDNKNKYLQILEASQNVLLDLRPFEKIKDNFRKILLTTDEIEFNHNGIEQMNIERWLLG